MYPNLAAELKRKEKKQEDIAKLLSIRLATVNGKMNGKSEFKISEFKTIKKQWFPNCSLDYLSITKEELEKEE